MPINDSPEFEAAMRFESLQRALPAWLPRQRWFGAKTRAVTSVEIIDWVALSSTTALVFVDVFYADGEPDTYQLPLSNPAADDIHEATRDEDFRQALFKLIEDQATLALHHGGSLSAQRSSHFETLRGQQPLPAKVSSAEQSNTSILFGDKMILKLFRRLQSGENPDVEISRFLTDVAHFASMAALLGEITVQLRGGEMTSIAMLQQLIPNLGDGWQWTLEEIARSPEIADSTYLKAASLLGQRTAEMHLALATDTTDEAFRSEPLNGAELEADAQRIRTQIDAALGALERAIPSLEGDLAADAAKILLARSQLIAHVDALPGQPPSGKIVRIHGDYHLGQILRTADDFVILDFEGEPASSLAERRRKRCPLKDVAGMLRSFSYVAWTASEQRPALVPQLQAWQDAVSAQFLSSYLEILSTQPGLLPESGLANSLLRAYLLEKACYELLYELNNRPAWVGIPIAGILALFAAPGR